MWATHVVLRCYLGPPGTVITLSTSRSVDTQVVQVTLESGLGHRTIPLLLAESSFSGMAKNWSSLLHLKADMTLEVSTDHRLAHQILKLLPVR